MGTPAGLKTFPKPEENTSRGAQTISQNVGIRKTTVQRGKKSLEVFHPVSVSDNDQ